MNRFKFLIFDLKVEVIYRKEGTIKNSGIDFKIGDISTSTHTGIGG